MRTSHRIDMLLACAGGTLDAEALEAFLAAALASHAAMPALRASLARAELDGDLRVLDWMIARAHLDNVLTKPAESVIRALFSAGELTLKGADAILRGLPKLPAVPECPTWQGRTYDQLLPLEREELRAEQPDLFKAMRTNSERGN